MGTTITRGTGGSLAVQTFVAGIIGAIGTDAFISIGHQTSPLNVWRFIASSAVGQQAFTTPGFVWLGLVMHLITALFWAYLYAYVWSRVNTLRNWVLGGIVLGLIVDVCMDGVMAFRGVLGPQTPVAILFGLITNVVFYGLLVASYLSRSASYSQE